MEPNTVLIDLHEYNKLYERASRVEQLEERLEELQRPKSTEIEKGKLILKDLASLEKKLFKEPSDKICALTNAVDAKLNSFADEALKKAIDESENLERLQLMTASDTVSQQTVAKNERLYKDMWHLAEVRFQHKKRDYIAGLSVK